MAPARVGGKKPVRSRGLPQVRRRRRGREQAQARKRKKKTKVKKKTKLSKMRKDNPGNRTHGFQTSKIDLNQCTIMPAE